MFRKLIGMVANAGLGKDPHTRVNKKMQLLSTVPIYKLKKQGLIFDYSFESLGRAEDILEQLHQQHLAGNLDQKEMFNAVTGWGAYLGEVFKKELNGGWQEEGILSPPGLPSFFLPSGAEVATFAKVAKRIAEGPEDNIEAYAFMVLVSEKKASSPQSESDSTGDMPSHEGEEDKS